MPTFRHLYKPIPKDSDQSEDIPLVTVNKKPPLRICKCPHFVLAELGHKGNLQASHPRFGPFYREGESEVSGKKEAWDKILEKSGDKNKTLESYLSAVRRIEKDARDAYGDRALHTLTESQFRWMMIEDGCFFLQLALLILGVSSNQLGYPDNHIIFGKKQNREDIKRWIESMFFVGNQIPIVVLNELMKQRFFQNILADVNSWDVPSELSKRILYELLVLPSDLLHALHCLMLGSRGGLRRDLVQDETEDDDLESGPNMESKDITFSATELEKKGIRFGKLEPMGCREIVFTDYILFARLYLPTFVVDDDTEALWKSLKYYEMSQHQGKGKGECEVRSNYKEKLPILLTKLAGKNKSTTQNLHLLRIQLRDYSLAPWERFKIVAILVFILTVVQTFFAILAYFRPPRQK